MPAIAFATLQTCATELGQEIILKRRRTFSLPRANDVASNTKRHFVASQQSVVFVGEADPSAEASIALFDLPSAVHSHANLVSATTLADRLHRTVSKSLPMTKNGLAHEIPDTPDALAGLEHARSVAPN
jgi:hypothetical protein